MGGGGGGGPTQQTITQTNVPDWLRPQVETVLGGAMQQLFNTREIPGTTTPGQPIYDPETGALTGYGPSTTTPAGYEITGVRPFQPFGLGGAGTSPEAMQAAQAAVAGFSPLQNQAMLGAYGLGVPSALNQAAQTAGNVAARAGSYGYTPGMFGAQNVNAPALSQYQMQGPGNVTGAAANAARLDAAPQTAGAQGIAALAGAAPTMNAAQAQAAQLGSAPTVGAAQMQGPGAVGYERVGAERVGAPSLRDLQMQAAAPVSAERVSTPFMSAAQTSYRPDLQAFQMQAPSDRVTSESFARPGTAESFMSPYIQNVVERQQQAAQREADIQAQARKAQFAQAGAFGGARQSVESARMAEALARQKGDIQAQGLQSAYQQAQQQFNTEQQARQAAQQANLQAGLTVGQQNLASQLGVQQLGTQTGLQTSLANLSSSQQANVQNQAAQLQAQGLNAQQALQAALANQGVQQQAGIQNLSAALQTQGLGAQTGMQAQQLNQQTGLQALLANQQAGMQMGQFNAQMGYNTALQNAQLQQQAALANQQMMGQYGLQQGQFGQAAALQNAQLQQAANAANQQLAGQYGLTNLGNTQQMALANLQNQQAANLANQQMLGQYGLQQGQFGQAAALQNAQLAQQAALANQQTGFNVGQQNLAAQLGVQQLGAGQSLQAQQLNQATRLQAQQAAEQSRQFAANVGLQGMGQQLAAAQAQGQLGAQQLASQQGIIGLQNQLGALQQQQEQNILNQAISNYGQAQQFPLQQYNAYNALLRGYAIPGQTATTYQAAPSMLNQLTGLGTAAYGAYRMFGQREGGPVKMATGGVASLNARVLEDPYEFSPEQIKRGVKNGLISDLIGVPALSQIEKFKQQAQAMQAAQQSQQPPIAQALLADKPQGIPALPSNLPADGYAGGGIVAFKNGGLSDDEFIAARNRQRQADVQNMSPEQKLVYRVVSAMNPADPGRQLDPYKLAIDFASAEPDKKQRTLNSIFNSQDPKIIPLVAEYRNYTGSTRAEAPAANAPEGTRSQREEQARQDRAAMLRLPAAAADILGFPANLALRAQDSVTSAINQVANTVGIPRLLRATGIAGPDFTEINFPKIAPSSFTPVYDLLRRHEAGKPQGPSGEVLDLILASQGQSAPGIRVSDPSVIFGGIGSGTRSGASESRADADAGANRISYDLLSRDFYEPRTPPAEISPTLMSGEAMLARSEADRRKRLEEAALANAPIYRLLQEGVEKQEGRLAGMDERNKAMALIAMGLQMAQHRGSLGSAIGAGGIEGLSTYMKGDAAKRAAEEKLEDARRSYAIQRLAMEKGDRQTADQAARETQKNLEEANRFAALSTQQQNIYNLQRYKAREDAASEAAKLRLQRELGIEGLKIRRDQIGAQGSRDFFRVAAIMQDAREQAAREVQQELAANPVAAATMKPEEREKMIQDRANRIASRVYLGSIRNLRVDEE